MPLARYSFKTTFDFIYFH